MLAKCALGFENAPPAMPEHGDGIPLFSTLLKQGYMTVMKRPSLIELDTVMTLAVVGGATHCGAQRAIFVLINH